MAEGGDKHPLADKLKSALDALSIGDTKSRPKSNYAFWSTQPVSQFGEAEEGSSSATGVRDGSLLRRCRVIRGPKGLDCPSHHVHSLFKCSEREWCHRRP